MNFLLHKLGCNRKYPNSQLLNNFTLGGSECADNLENPASFNLSDGELAFTYNNIPIRRAGVAKESGEAKVLTIGFPFEAISTSTEREQFMGLVLNYILQPGVGFEDNEVAHSVATLAQNSPNPFNPNTTILFTTPEDCQDVKIYIYIMKGQLITNLPVSRNGKNGTAFWNGMDQNGNGVSSGTYMYKMQADKTVEMKKMLLMK